MSNTTRFNEEQLEDLKRKIRSVKLCLMAHPDNEPDSEFADRISDMVDIEELLYTVPAVSDKEEEKERGWTINTGQVKTGSEVPDDCQYTDDSGGELMCNLPIGSCKQCQSEQQRYGAEIKLPCICDNCNKAYSYDLTVPDTLWAVIAPKPVEGYKGGGLLCPECILNKTILFYVTTLGKYLIPDSSKPINDIIPKD